MAGSMKIVRIRERIKQGAADFERSWGKTNPDLKCHWKDDGTTFGDMLSTLRSLDLETCSAADVNGIIGRAWASLQCDNCGKEVDALMHFGDEPDYGARWQDLCAECLVLGIERLKDAKP